jgi:hypothetical protein
MVIVSARRYLSALWRSSSLSALKPMYLTTFRKPKLIILPINIATAIEIISTVIDRTEKTDPII